MKTPDEDFRWRSKRWFTNNYLVVIDEFITVKFFRLNESIRRDNNKTLWQNFAVAGKLLQDDIQSGPAEEKPTCNF